MKAYQKIREIVYSLFGASLGMCFLFVLFKMTEFPDISPEILYYSLWAVLITGATISVVDGMTWIFRWPIQFNHTGKQFIIFILGWTEYSFGVLNQIPMIMAIGLTLVSLAVLFWLGLRLTSDSSQKA
jgi:hypothetical protein